jgi:hypothetical protein
MQAILAALPFAGERFDDTCTQETRDRVLRELQKT